MNTIATAIMGRIDRESTDGRQRLVLRWTNAGHPPPMLMRGGKISELTSNNLVLGIDPNEHYEQSIIDLRSGDVVLMYTDGLTDAMNFQRVTYGKQRLMLSLSDARGSAEEIAQKLLWDMRRYVGLTERVDDVTLMVVRVA